MGKFRKKPVVIEAEQFNPKVAGGTRNGFEATVRTGEIFMDYEVYADERGPFLLIPTLEGNMRADPGDWIITGVKGERYPCKDDIFQATYDAVDDERAE